MSEEVSKPIYIENPDKSSGITSTSPMDFVGFIPIHELMQEEMA